MTYKSKKTEWLVTALLVIFALTFLYPLLWLIINSLKDTNEIMTGNAFGFPQKLKFSNYSDALIERNILRYFLNSTIVTSLTLLLTTFTAFIFSYGIVRMHWKGCPKLTVLVTLGLMLPSQIVIVPIFLMLRKMHLINNPLSLVLTISAFNLSITTLISSSFIKSIPREMEEAAIMDGAGLWTILSKVIAPQMVSAFSSMAIIIFMNSWNEFIYALVLITGKTWRTLPVALMNYSSGKYGTDYGGLYAAMVITSFLPVILFISFSKEVEKSLSAGALLK